MLLWSKLITQLSQVWGSLEVNKSLVLPAQLSFSSAVMSRFAPSSSHVLAKQALMKWNSSAKSSGPSRLQIILLGGSFPLWQSRGTKTLQIWSILSSQVGKLYYYRNWNLRLWLCKTSSSKEKKELPEDHLSCDSSASRKTVDTLSPGTAWCTVPALHCSGCVQKACASTVGALGWLLTFGVFPCWTASAAGKGLSADVAFYSHIFSFKSVGIGLHPKLQKYLEKDLG